MMKKVFTIFKKWVTRMQTLARAGRWLRIAAYVIAVLFIALLLLMGWKNRETILPFLINADYSQLADYIAFYLISYSAAVSGWCTIIYTFNDQLDWWTHTQIYCMTMATRHLPGTLWYIGGRIVLYQQLGLFKPVILLANAIELIVQYLTASIMGLLFLYFSKSELSTTTVVALIASTAIASLILHPSIFNWILRKIDLPQSTDISSSRIIIWIFFYAINWLFGGLMLNQLVTVFKPGGIDQMLYIIGAWMLSATASMLTIFLPSSFGVKELALTALLAPILPLPLAGTVAILMRFLTTILEVIVSVVFYLIGLKSPRLGVILKTQQSQDRSLISKKVE